MPHANRKLPLDGWYVISLRPLGQHGGVRRIAAKFGAATFALSTLRLQPVDAKASLRQVLRCARVVVTSPAAARLANEQIALRRKAGQMWFALGAGTAAALRRSGVDQVIVPALGSDSEALLAHEGLAEVSGETVGMITAPGGRGLLASELQARGANLQIAEVYRRQALRLSSARLRALDALPASTALLFTSGEAFSVLWQALDDPTRMRLLRRHCLVGSDRLAVEASALGFSSVLRAGDARPASLLSTLADHVGERRFR